MAPAVWFPPCHPARPLATGRPRDPVIMRRLATLIIGHGAP